MKPICLFFQVHQPIRLRTYRFFDIGINHDYYNDFLNKTTLRRIGDNCYIPMNNLLMDMIEEYGDNIKISLSISGTTIEQFKWYTPDVLDSFKKLIKTGNVEILSQPYNFSFSSIANKELFKYQVQQENQLIHNTFNVKTKAFKNTELLFNEDISDTILDMGYDTVIIEGARHLLGWKPAENVYCSSKNPHLKLLTRTYGLCDDLSFRFNNKQWDQWPLTADKYFNWVNQAIQKGNCLTLALEYETFGEYCPANSGIFDFARDFIKRIVASNDIYMATPYEITHKIVPSGQLHIPYNMTWADEEKDTAAWLGNELQTEAFKQLYSMTDKISKCNDHEIQKDFMFIQSVDNLLYMCTKLFVVRDTIHHLYSPYYSPYDAFINYMNVISDMQIRLDNIQLQEQNNGTAFTVNQPENDLKLKWNNIVKLDDVTIKKVLKNLSDNNIVFLINNLHGKDRKIILNGLSLPRQRRLKASAKIKDADTSKTQIYRNEIEKTISEIINS